MSRGRRPGFRLSLAIHEAAAADLPGPRRGGQRLDGRQLQEVRRYLHGRRGPDQPHVGQHGRSEPLWQRMGSAPQLGSCASSGHVWRLRTARHSQYEASPQSAQPLPRLLELAASKAAAFDHPGDTNPSPGPGRALTLALALSLTLTLTLALTLPLTRWGDSFRYEVKTIMMEN